MLQKTKHKVRRLGHLLVWMLSRAGLWYANFVPGNVSCRRGLPPRKSMLFESLEPRLLLSADLMPVALDTAPLNSANDAGAHVSIIVRNTGDTVPDRPVIVNLYAAPDGAAANDAVQIGSATLDAASLAPNGADVSASIALDLTPLTVPGAYTLRAEVDPDGLIAEVNENNNQLSLDAALNLAAPYSSLAGGNINVAFDAAL